MLQNANDAMAKRVEILFAGATPVEDQSDSAAPVLMTTLTLRNNGRPFSEEDWQRLKKIAEGNPDEQKVRAACSKEASLGV